MPSDRQEVQSGLLADTAGLRARVRVCERILRLRLERQLRFRLLRYSHGILWLRFEHRLPRQSAEMCEQQMRLQLTGRLHPAVQRYRVGMRLVQ